MLRWTRGDKVVASAEEQLSDINYLTPRNRYSSGDPLRYEKAMLDRWFEARIGSRTQYSLRFHPLLSKRIETEIGDVIPYTSLPMGVTVQSGGTDETFVPVQFVAGSELRPLEMKNWSFIGEVGINLTRSFGYATIGLAYRFEDASFGKK